MHAYNHYSAIQYLLLIQSVPYPLSLNSDQIEISVHLACWLVDLCLFTFICDLYSHVLIFKLFLH